MINIIFRPTNYSPFVPGVADYPTLTYLYSNFQLISLYGGMVI